MVVTVTSGYALLPATRAPIYSATKAALHSFTLSLRRQAAAAGIRVVEVLPPLVDTPATSAVTGRKMSAEELVGRVLRDIGKGRDESLRTGRPAADPDAPRAQVHRAPGGPIMRRGKSVQAETAQPWVICRPGALRPTEQPVGRADRHIVDAGLAPAHQTLGVEFPLLVAVRAVPVAGVVAPFVLEAHRDAVAVERPELLDQAVLQLARPLPPQERDDGRRALEELRAVAPAAVLGIGRGDPFRIAGVPGVLGHSHLLRRALQREWRQRRSCHDVSFMSGGCGGIGPAAPSAMSPAGSLPPAPRCAR